MTVETRAPSVQKNDSRENKISCPKYRNVVYCGRFTSFERDTKIGFTKGKRHSKGKNFDAKGKNLRFLCMFVLVFLCMERNNPENDQMAI
ncbi:MAG: hypothetical protein BGO29_05220 [Bacteroidales bacterium 36-12]|nr:MAG: hypothetical protein BGO29_05220 [Bacteroidales bacterium 36-12]